jgi:hypothetical protein
MGQCPIRVLRCQLADSSYGVPGSRTTAQAAAVYTRRTGPVAVRHGRAAACRPQLSRARRPPPVPLPSPRRSPAPQRCGPPQSGARAWGASDRCGALGPPAVSTEGRESRAGGQAGTHASPGRRWSGGALSPSRIASTLKHHRRPCWPVTSKRLMWQGDGRGRAASGVQRGACAAAHRLRFQRGVQLGLQDDNVLRLCEVQPRAALLELRGRGGRRGRGGAGEAVTGCDEHRRMRARQMMNTGACERDK